MSTPVIINRPQALWLVDASIYIYRPWYTGDENITNSAGESIHAYLGFVAFVDDLLRNEKPHNIAFAFDEPQTQSYRRKIYPSYKRNRKKTQKNLQFQIELCRDYIHNLGLVQASSPKYEADDIIASWAKDSTESVIVSADKDLTQLVRPQDLWCDYEKGYCLKYNQIIKRFGVRPEQIADLLALAGDKADNIPGATGIGMATAAKLLAYFGSLDKLLSSIEQIATLKFRGAYFAKLAIEKEQDQIRIYRKLTGLQTDVLESKLLSKTPSI